MSNETLWIINALILTQNAQREVLRGHLELAGGRIVAIHADTVKPPTSVRSLDASGLLVMPGLIQPHIHLCQTLFRNLADELELLDWLSERIWPFEAAHTAESLYLSAQLAFRNYWPRAPPRFWTWAPCATPRRFCRPSPKAASAPMSANA